jgi:quaternary ammonium compound-resistance protein SugE
VFHQSNTKDFYDPRIESEPAMTAWLSLCIAGLLEIVWTLGLKQSHGFTRFWPSLVTIVSIPLSFGFLALSLHSVPFGTAYAVWVGIGAAGVAAVGIFHFGESADLTRLLFLALIVIGAIGLKFGAE